MKQQERKTTSYTGTHTSTHNTIIRTYVHICARSWTIDTCGANTRGYTETDRTEQYKLCLICRNKKYPCQYVKRNWMHSTVVRLAAWNSSQIGIPNTLLFLFFVSGSPVSAVSCLCPFRSTRGSVLQSHVTAIVNRAHATGYRNS